MDNIDDERTPFMQEKLLPKKKRRYSFIWALWMSLSILFCLTLFGIMILMSTVLYEQVFGNESLGCEDDPNIRCKLRIVESIPANLTYNNSIFDNMRTFEAWKELLNRTEVKLELASSYWSLRGSDVYPDESDWQGEEIFKGLLDLAVNKSVDIEIAQNAQENKDTLDLWAKSGGKIRFKNLNFSALVGNGILHTKLWISDRKHFYVGSANFDWRSLTQVKEMGVLVTDCPCLARDMSKIWQTYWIVGNTSEIPMNFPRRLRTKINAENPLKIRNDFYSGVNGSGNVVNVSLSASPPELTVLGRGHDIDELVRMIDKAEKFLYVAVMDYSAATVFDRRKVTFWPKLDNAIRRAAIERKVAVKLLFSLWKHSPADLFSYLNSLTGLNGTQNGKVSVEGRLFKVPADEEQVKIPYARVNHNKYVVTDKSGFVSTSNFQPDYFISTGGIGIWLESKEDVRRRLEDVFLRDWNSKYARKNNSDLN